MATPANLRVLAGGRSLTHPDFTTTPGALVLLVVLELAALVAIRAMFKSAHGG